MGKLFGENMSAYVQYAVAFVTILILLLLLAYVLRLITRRRPGGVTGRGRAPRLGVIEVFDLDRQRQLVLLRRDNVEHLVMIGGPNDVVVESAFVRSGAARVPVPQLDADRTDEEGAVRLEAPEQVARPVIGERETTAYRPAAPTGVSATAVTAPIAQESAPKPPLVPAVTAQQMTPPPVQPVIAPPPVLPTTTVRQPAPYRPSQPPVPPPNAPVNQTATAPMPPVAPAAAPSAPTPPAPPPQPPLAAAPREKSGFASRLEDAMRRPFSSAPRAEPQPAPAPAPASPPTVPPPAPAAPPQQPAAPPAMRPPAATAPVPPPAPPKPAAPVESPAPVAQNPAPASKPPTATDPFDLGALEDEMAKLLGRAGPKK